VPSYDGPVTDRSATGPAGWRPLQSPRRPSGTGFVTSPFTRLARTHALSVAGDTLVALALAGSLFFSIDASAARPKVALYLVLTVAPFSVVAPLIGPAIDRMAGGRKLMVILSGMVRAVVCALMVGHIDSLFLFPEAFTVMVAAKSYSVAKSALVPTVVGSEEELVEANSKLSLISGVVGFTAGAPALPLLWLDLPGAVMGLAAVAFVAAAVSGLQLPRTQVAAEPAGPAEVAELRSTGIILAASAMGLLRAMVGFLTFHIAFFFRNDGAPTWWFGIPVALSGIGSLTGAALAPIVRRHTREELMVIQVLGLSCLVGLLATWGGGRWSASFLAGVLGLSAAFAKLAFDSIVQRDAPDANQGRSFARFETRFQLGWVVGAFLPVVMPIPAWVGFLIVALVTGFAAFTYLWGLRYVRSTGQMPPTFRQLLAERGWLPRVNVPGEVVPSWLRRATRRGARRSGTDADATQPAGPPPPPPSSSSDGATPGAPPGPVSVARSPLQSVVRRRRPPANVPDATPPAALPPAALPPPGSAPPPRPPRQLPPPAPAPSSPPPPPPPAGGDDRLPLDWSDG